MNENDNPDVPTLRAVPVDGQPNVYQIAMESRVSGFSKEIQDMFPDELSAHVPSVLALRHGGMVLARDFMEICPDSRERSLALTRLHEASMWAIRAIALHGPRK